MTESSTIERLAREVVDALDEGASDDEIRAEVDSVVSPMTTVLFQLVVDDNALAFLDYEGEATTPFDMLRGAIIEAVEQRATEMHRS